MAASTNKKPSNKRVDEPIWEIADWAVRPGRLVPYQGRPTKTARLFGVVGEKLPYESLSDVRKHVHELRGDSLKGVYLAHDSMGVARYGGRGIIFDRLAAHKRKYPSELLYFSFYEIANKAHEREIETVILRAAGPQLVLNERKTASHISPGNISDYEPGTLFYERLPRGVNGQLVFSELSYPFCGPLRLLCASDSRFGRAGWRNLGGKQWIKLYRLITVRLRLNFASKKALTTTSMDRPLTMAIALSGTTMGACSPDPRGLIHLRR